MSNQPAKPLSKRILNITIRIVVIIVLIIGAKLLYRVIWRSITAPKIVDAIHATFPNFCQDGQVLANTHIDVLETIMTNYNNHLWSIQCYTWKKYSDGFRLNATIVDLDTCMTIDPFFYDKNGEYATEIKAMSGQKLAFCP